MYGDTLILDIFFFWEMVKLASWPVDNLDSDFIGMYKSEL